MPDADFWSSLETLEDLKPITTAEGTDTPGQAKQSGAKRPKHPPPSFPRWKDDSWQQANRELAATMTFVDLLIGQTPGDTQRYPWSEWPDNAKPKVQQFVQGLEFDMPYEHD